MRSHESGSFCTYVVVFALLTHKATFAFYMYCIYVSGNCFFNGKYGYVVASLLLVVCDVTRTVELCLSVRLMDIGDLVF